MRIPGVKSLRRWSRLSSGWVKSRFVNTALILAYHRVAEVESDPYSLCVTPQRFAEQLDVLRQYSHPMRLQQLTGALATGNVPERSVALTFDDGYNDNLYNGKPLLERYQLPATVFVTTGFLGREFWWDELDRVLPLNGPLHKPLCFRVNGRNYQWDLNRYADRVRNGIASSSRQSLLGSLHKLLRTLPEEERQNVMKQIRSWSVSAPKTLPRHVAVTPAEIIRLAEGTLVEVGAHTVTHPFLATLPADVQRTEIQTSKAQLEKILSQPVLSFSYPNGSTSAASATIVRQAGFSCACASTSDVAWRGSDRFRLPRLWVPNWDGVTFSRWLFKWWRRRSEINGIGAAR